MFLPEKTCLGSCSTSCDSPFQWASLNFAFVFIAALSNLNWISQKKAWVFVLLCFFCSTVKVSGGSAVRKARLSPCTELPTHTLERKESLLKRRHHIQPECGWKLWKHARYLSPGHISSCCECSRLESLLHCRISQILWEGRGGIFSRYLMSIQWLKIIFNSLKWHL